MDYYMNRRRPECGRFQMSSNPSGTSGNVQCCCMSSNTKSGPQPNTTMTVPAGIQTAPRSNARRNTSSGTQTVPQPNTQMNTQMNSQTDSWQNSQMNSQMNPRQNIQMDSQMNPRQSSQMNSQMNPQADYQTEMQQNIRTSSQSGFHYAPTGNLACPGSVTGPVESYPLGMGYVPFQQWNQTYSLAEGLTRGTIFPELDLPFVMGRCQ